MTNKTRIYFYAILLFAFTSLQCNNNKTTKEDNNSTTKEDEHGLGLKLAKAEDYYRVQAAELPFGADQGLPPVVDLSSDMPQVQDQGRQQSCVAWSTSYALKGFSEKRKRNISLLFSPSFVYNQINGGKDEGSYFEDALNVLSQQGTALLEDMPYDPGNYTRQPTPEIKQKAKPFTILKWQRINTQDMKEVKMHLKRGFPVIIGAHVDEGFRAGKKDGTQEYVWERPSGKPIGDHAMVVVGFDDSKNAFRVMNSWGTYWGNDGYCWINYEHFQKVVPQGYIVFDQQTNTNPNTRPDNTVIDNRPVDNTVINNKTIIDDPSQYAKANLRGIQVQHNIMDNTYGYCMKISGYIDIPAGLGKTFQISNHFYLSNSTQQAKSLMYPTFADLNGFAATGSILYSVPAEGLKNYYWECLMPYKAIDLPYEVTYFYFVPTLFIDNFGYAKGEAVNFYVNKKFLN